MKIFYSIFLLIISTTFSFSQKKNAAIKSIAKPKLVVGIVIDQMRWDYLERYADRYSNKGFRRLMNEGFNCASTFIPYTPTYTAPGHTCIYTGSVPAIHGIAGNYWYDKDLGKDVYCTDDTFKTVGSASSAGNMSPANLWTTTIGDELRLATNFRSKVIGISLKDRSAILPAGHSANGAYWFDNASGNFITSTFYRNDLPAWLNAFNNRKLPDEYLNKNWQLLYPLQSYLQSTADDKNYESSIPAEDNTFPHITQGIAKDKYNVLRFTPYGNTLMLDMAKAAIEGEKLGQSGNTDMLALSFSAADYVGHFFGPNSIETEDMYLRLDSDLAALLAYLDAKIGKDAYTIFLSADHGAAHIPAFLNEHKIPAGHLTEDSIAKALNEFIEKRFNISNAVEKITNQQVYLKQALEKEDVEKVKQASIGWLLKLPVIANVVDLRNLSAAVIPAQLKAIITNGYNQKRSGDLQFIYKPQFIDDNSKGTTHGAWNPYDTHIPLLWFGWGIKQGKTFRETYMTDIAPTLAALLRIQMPSGCVGKVIEEVMK